MDGEQFVVEFVPQELEDASGGEFEGLLLGRVFHHYAEFKFAGAHGARLAHGAGEYVLVGVLCHKSVPGLEELRVGEWLAARLDGDIRGVLGGTEPECSGTHFLSGGLERLLRFGRRCRGWCDRCGRFRLVGCGRFRDGSGRLGCRASWGCSGRIAQRNFPVGVVKRGGGGSKQLAETDQGQFHE